MKRREFLTVAASAGAASFASAGAIGAPQQPAADSTPRPFKLKYAPHFGMFAHHAKDELDQIGFAADEGFAAWEDNGMAGRDKDFQDRFAQRLQKHNMQMGIFVAHHIDWQNPTLTTGDAVIRDRFVSDIKASTEVAKRINATWVTTVIGRIAQNLPMGHQFANVVEALRRAAEACEPSGMVMVVEPLNWRDHPGQFGNTSDVLRAVVKAVDHPSVRILQDLYHLQVTEGNLIDNMDRSWDDIAYFQTGDNPGRCEPGTGEVNYRNVFKHIHQRGYGGILGMEHGASVQGKEGERKVIEAYRVCDAF
jgi:hydroxypyruvate isomerase